MMQSDNVNHSLQVAKGAARGKTALKKIYKNIDGYIVMFDVTNPESYDNVVGWKSDIDTVHPPNHIPPCIVVANKVCLAMFRSGIGSCWLLG